MDKTTLGLIGAISSLAVIPAASATAAPSASPVPPAGSYAELLDPIPNAVERLQLADAQAQHGGARLIEAQYADPNVNQHHHHHHHWRHRRRHHHHHHQQDPQ